ncbi:MAG: helix-turn-helix domain-containing protein, partial [Candidatus Taylorbacteria bacterium]
GNKSLKEITGIRDMTIDTVISHIEEILSVGDKKKGEDLTQKDIAYLKYEISPQHFPKIEKALEEVCQKQNDGKPPLLSPTKTKVGNNISFRDIRLARVLLGYFKPKHNDTEHEKGVLEEVREEPF